MPRMKPPAGRYVCHVCGDDFSRPDHLSRHARSHTSETPYVCPICGKAFSRQDSLGRHRRGHDSAGPGGHRSIFNRASRACCNCSKSKLACDGKQPCRRCEQRGFECKYTVKTSRRKTIARCEQSNSPPSAATVPATTIKSDAVQSEQMPPVPAAPYANPAASGATPLPAANHASVANGEPLAAEPRNVPENNGYSNQHYQSWATPAVGQSVPLQGHPQPATIHPSVHPAQGGPSRPGMEQAPTAVTSIAAIVDHPVPNMNHQPYADGQTAALGPYNHLQPATQMGYDATQYEEAASQLPFGLQPLPPTVPLMPNFDMGDWMTSYLDGSQYEPFPLDPNMAFRSIGGPNNVPTQVFPNGRYQEMPPAESPGEPNTMKAPYVAPQQPPAGDRQVPAAGDLQPVTPPTTSRADSATALSPLGGGVNGKPNASSAQLTPTLPAESTLKTDDGEQHVSHLLDFGHVDRLSAEGYEKIVGLLENLDTDRNLLPELHSRGLFSVDMFNCFIQLYFEHFQPLLPLLHQPSFDPSKDHWLVVLAVTSIGSRFFKGTASGAHLIALTELTRRAVLQVIETDKQCHRALWLSQATLLSILAMSYTGERSLLDASLVFRRILVSQCRRNGALKGGATNVAVDRSSQGSALDESWKHWVQVEGYRRLGLSCFLVDRQLTLHFDIPALMRMVDIQQPLSSPENLWEIPSSGGWKSLYFQKYSASRPVPISAAIRYLSTHRTLPAGVGRFGALVLVHTIFVTFSELRQQFDDPTSNMLMCCTSLQAELRLQETRDKVRSILDAVRVSVNESTAHLGGQHLWPGQQLQFYVCTTVHHVSLLLDPTLDDLLAFAGGCASNKEMIEAERRLLNWVQYENGQTARRSIINASLLFSLIRRHPCGGYHEPIAFLVATLTIWSYIYLTRNLAEPEGNSSRRTLDNHQTIRLDTIRSMENAKPWIQDGTRVRGYLTDIGNISAPGAGQRLLQIACETLGSMDTWGFNQGFATVLSTLKGRTSNWT